MPSPPPVVDAHQHFWDLHRFTYPWMDPGLTVLHRTILPDDLRPILRNAGVDRTVLVQAIHSAREADWFLELAAAYDFIAGVVAWVDLTDPALGRQLDRLQKYPKFKGVRHQVHDEPDEAWLLRDDVLNGLTELARRGIPYDLLVRAPHLPCIPRIAARIPDLRMVVDHIAKPPISAGHVDAWAEAMRPVAELPNVWCKLSGMVTEADWKTWTPADLKPFVDLVVEQFGYNRLLFGSDWPVCLLAAPYERVLEALLETLAPLSQADRAAVLGGNAVRFYHLD